MLRDWRENRRWHLFKSVTGKFILADNDESNESEYWKLYEQTLASYCLKLLTFGIIEGDAWIDDSDFTDEEKAKICENLI